MLRQKIGEGLVGERLQVLPLSRDDNSSACKVSGSKPISLRLGAIGASISASGAGVKP